MNTTDYERATTLSEDNPILNRKIQDVLVLISKFFETDYKNTSSWVQKRRLKKIKKLEWDLSGVVSETNPETGHRGVDKAYFSHKLKEFKEVFPNWSKEIDLLFKLHNDRNYSGGQRIFIDGKFCNFHQNL